MTTTAIVAAVWLAVTWRVLPWFLRRARAAPACDDGDGYLAAIFWPVTLLVYVFVWNARPLRREIERRVAQVAR